jgi:hypothetical protein
MHNAVSILTPKRDRLSLHSFSIRDLFLVTMIVAVCVAWWLDHRRQGAEIYRINNQWESSSSVLLGPPKSLAPAPSPPKP